ncbi:MAG: hypothetical protein EBQ65_04045 [Chitinophagaceae bacterium]|nr:hypothetical protein [Chitinophagaceae bacterium]
MKVNKDNFNSAISNFAVHAVYNRSGCPGLPRGVHLGGLCPLARPGAGIPGSIQYSIKRYRKQPDWDLEDLGMVVYHYEKKKPSERYLELRFCVSGNVYCREKDKECDRCQFAASPSCLERVESVDLVSFRFSPTQLRQFVKAKKTDSLHDNILQFKHGSSFVKTHPICPKTSHVLDSILNNNYNDTERIFLLMRNANVVVVYNGLYDWEQSTDIVK